MFLALDAIGLREGDEVVPTMTFAATAEVVVYCKARPLVLAAAILFVGITDNARAGLGVNLTAFLVLALALLGSLAYAAAKPFPVI